MSNVDRKSYLSAIALDQTLLDNCADNLENKIEMIVEIETNNEETIYTNTIGNLVSISAPGHNLNVGNVVIVDSSDDSGLIGNWTITNITTIKHTQFIIEGGGLGKW